MKEFFLADDLSGALDAAAAFHRAGRRVQVVLSPTGWIASGDTLIGVTTETRNAAPAKAAAVVEAALACGGAQGARLVYKKIDSTLRGPVAAEIGALVRQLPGVRVLFNPANPGVGRTLRDGVLLVHGVPVSQTEYGRDPVSPVRESDVRRLLGDGPDQRIVFSDAETEADLAAAVARLAAAGDAWVAVGSGALARPVAALGARATPPGAGCIPVAIPAGPILMLCGSAHAGNRVQAATLARERGVPVHELSVTEPAAAIAAACARLRAGDGASLVIESARRDSAEVLRALAAAAHEIIATAGVRRVFATGGETAYALCGALGISAFDFAAEIESGLSLSCAATNRGPLRFAIKPGGFGTPGTWVRAWDALRGAEV
jgi:uncharacterized protein YgbK (DUF1537 family)